MIQKQMIFLSKLFSSISVMIIQVTLTRENFETEACELCGKPQR